MTPQYLKFWMLLSLLSISVASFSQNNREKVAALSATFKDDKLVASTYETLITFEIQRDEMIVNEDEEINMISLEPNTSGSREIYYHDQKEIVSAKFISGNGNSSSKTCGNYEVEGVFYSDAKVCSYLYKFSYGGDEMTFAWRAQYRDPRYFTRISFHDELGVKKRTVTFKIPAGVNIELVEKNFSGFEINKTVAELANLKTITYTVENLKAPKQEDNSLGMLYYYPHIVVVTKDFAGRDGRKKVIASTDDLYGWYANIVKQVKNDPIALKTEVSRLTATATTPEETIRNIYYWVQDNIKYIAFEDGISGFKPESAQNVFNNRYGDCKGMANLTKEMLKVTGLDARLSWIGTNRIPYTYDLPSLVVDNHMICVVYAGGTEYILDPTEKFIALGKHGERIQGKEMMIENGDKFIVKKVPVADADQNLIVRKEDISLEGALLKGNGRVSIEGEALKDILYLSTNIRQENQKRLFHHIVVSDHGSSDEVIVSNHPEIDRDKPLELEYTYRLDNKVTTFDNDLYIDIDWIKKFQNLKIDSGRLSDYYFHRKIRDRVVKSIKIPSGYKVSHLPATIKKLHNDFSFELFFEQKGEVLIYTNEIIVKYGLIKVSDFGIWNECIKDLTEAYHDQIVLTKTN